MDSDGLLENVEHKVADFFKNNGSSVEGGKGSDDDAFKNFDNSFMTSDSNYHISSNHICKRILYLPICEGTSIRSWDVLLFLPNLTFVLFLAIRWPSTKRKLLATHSPIFRTFHLLVGLTSGIALIRSIIAMIVAHNVDEGLKDAELADKAFWILTTSLFILTEISVLVFGLAGLQLDSKQAICRVSLVSLLSASIYAISQSIMEFTYPDPLFEVFPKTTAHHNLYGYGTSLFCFVTSISFSVSYLIVAFLPFLPFVKRNLALPNKPAFYQYCGCLFLCHIMEALGAGLMYFKAEPNGLCFLNFATFLYVAGYTPLMYSTFLGPFFRSAQPTLLFTYKAQVDDEAEDDNDQNSGSMQFSLTQGSNDLNLDDEQESRPIVRPGANPLLIEGLSTPEVVTASVPQDSNIPKY